MPELTVIIPAHNPDEGRLGRTLAALRVQSLSPGLWETILVDNASAQFPSQARCAQIGPSTVRIVREPKVGLTAARCRGFAESRAPVCVLVDDDNVLAPNYLETVLRAFSAEPRLGAIGGRSLPEFESCPPPWAREFDGLLALRDLGPKLLRAAWSSPEGRSYPVCAPLGAGMAIRRSAADSYASAVNADSNRKGLDRSGSALVSGGDNDLVMVALEAGHEVAYLPDLQLTHLIPRRRIERDYLGALNRAIARSWVRALHGIVLWPASPPRSVWLRQARAWLRMRAWRGPAEWIRWQGACGNFEGRGDIWNLARSKAVASDS